MFLRTKEINLSPIKDIELLSSKIIDVISLAQGIPSFDTPEVVKKAAARALGRGAVAKYSLTYGLPELRETIEQKLAEERMYYDFEKEIIVTAGSIEAIAAILISVISPKKNEVVLFSPSYASYSEVVKVAGGAPVFVNLEEEKGWQINFKNLKKKISNKTAAILFCNPNNPTGSVFPKDDLLNIAEIAKEKNIFILSDEVYKDFIYENDYLPIEKNNKDDYFSLAQIPELRKSVIRIFSLSKAYAMTGWRIGFLHSDEENVKEILKIHDSLVTCAPVISQYAALAALDYGNKELDKFKSEFKKRRDLLCGHLDQLKDFFSYQKPKGSYFVFPKILTHAYRISKTANSRDFSLKILKGAKVALVFGSAFGPSGEHHLRMSFGRSEKDIDEAMKRIKKFLS